MDIISGFNLSKLTPSIRHVSEMKEVVFDKNWLKSQKNDQELYYMYRDLSRSPADLKKIRKHNLRFDITVIPPFMLGQEFIKTAGHYHPMVPNTKLSYTEIYEVLEGTAIYLMQKPVGENFDEVHDMKIVEAKAGNNVIIPPNYAHVTINATDEKLVMANWVSSKFNSNYTPIKRHRGEAFFLTKGKKWVPNPTYKDSPTPRIRKPTNFSKFGLKKDKFMYDIINEDPELIDFLNKPQDFPQLWKKISK
ncbi:MAG: glucose-6-phosphate isomerase [Candidatus Diapherotrites archaeon]|nr:glucose-6-phosphate isomerase [Candidatus Diapherotrites archaeon]